MSTLDAPLVCCIMEWPSAQYHTLNCAQFFYFFFYGTEHLRNTKSTVFFFLSLLSRLFHRAHIWMFPHVRLAALLMFNSGEKMVFLACRGVTQSDIVENERMLPASGLWRWNLHEINKIEWMLSNSLPLDCERPGVIEGPASLHLVSTFIKIVWLKRSDTNNLQWPVYNFQWINSFTWLHLFYTFSETIKITPIAAFLNYFITLINLMINLTWLKLLIGEMNMKCFSR